MKLSELKNKRYAIILFLMNLLTVYGLIKLRNKFQIKVFVVYMSIGSFFGWTWQIFVTYIDPNYCGWWYERHKIIGSIDLVSYEDVVFYPICGAFFFLIRLILPDIQWKLNYKAILGSIIFIGILGLLSIIIFEVGGKSSTYWFLIPGLLLMIYTRNELNFFRFIMAGIFIISFATIWDLYVKDWLYITADLHHSKIWLDYTTHKWAWIKRSPVEITPWFSFCGWVFIYPLAQACEKTLLKKSNPSV